MDVMQHTQNRNAILVLVALGLMLASCLCLVGLVWQSITLSDGTNDCLHPEPDTVMVFPAGFAGVAPQDGMTLYIPPSAHNIESDCFSFQGITMRLWFDMNPVDYDTFVEQSELVGISAPDQVQTGPMFGPSPRGGDQAGYFYARHAGPCPDGTQCGMSIWIEGTDPNMYRVYVAFAYGDP